jgi:glyoxylase-like metal-dependent hydrolase (beta-lactamase superfamily II)
MRMQTWTIGTTTITRIEEQVGPVGLPVDKFLVGFEREAFNRHLDWLVPNHFAPETDRMISSMHSWLVRTGRHTILVDGCCGNNKERPWMPRFHQLDTPFLANLRAAGAAPEDIDIVLCTHLHADHVGWNTRLENGRWVPTFPNARYLFSDLEDERWNPARTPGMDAERKVVYEDSVLPVVEAGLATKLSGAHSIDDSLHIEPAPGHTPGHVVLKLHSRDQRALFCGDVVHHAIQVFNPHWNSAFCEDQEQARRTRRQVLEHCAGENAVLFPTHFGKPYVAAIRATTKAFSPEFVNPGS